MQTTRKGRPWGAAVAVLVVVVVVVVEVVVEVVVVVVVVVGTAVVVVVGATQPSTGSGTWPGGQVRVPVQLPGGRQRLLPLP